MTAHDVLNLAILDSHDYPKPLISLPAYSSVGGYPILYLTEKNDILCAECATKEIRAWMYEESDDPPVNYGIYEQGPVHCCDDCGAETESAYGDPEENY